MQQQWRNLALLWSMSHRSRSAKTPSCMQCCPTSMRIIFIPNDPRVVKTLRIVTLTLQSLLFWCKKARTPRKKQGFLFLPNPENPWKRREKRTKKARKNAKQKKKKTRGKRKKQGLEGQGNFTEFTLCSKNFATAIVQHYHGHFESTVFKRKLSSKSLQIVKTTAVVKHYGIERRSVFSTEGSMRIIFIQALHQEFFSGYFQGLLNRGVSNGGVSRSGLVSQKASETTMKIKFAFQEKAHKHKTFWPVTPLVIGGSPDRQARGQRFMCYPRNPRYINLFVRAPDREDR